jgi:hypothetical protein
VVFEGIEDTSVGGARGIVLDVNSITELSHKHTPRKRHFDAANVRVNSSIAHPPQVRIKIYEISILSLM